ncbi:MAG TPA: hypothetical protein P5270_00965 [Victivallales bacterium]|nr:hypothetical protein [Victivallales bacterium]HPO90114.1 hypothetical protein [Victivallales bacterium]HRR27910.1 hypothetical protein [Victivallales bacterium]HRU00841.1 hypothetical protein [Victivallales bacterium]
MSTNIQKFTPLFLLFISFYASAFEKFELIIIEPNQQIINLLLNQNAAKVPQNFTRIAGVFNKNGFSIPEIKNLTVEDINGKKFPLVISQNDIVTEFGEIVSLWFYFDISKKYIDDGGTLFLLYGKDINSENNTSLEFAIKPEDKEFLKTFSWKDLKQADQTANLASIEVIADSKADYFFLWYLLPMAVILIILSFRKFNLTKEGVSNIEK